MMSIPLLVKIKFLLSKYIKQSVSNQLQQYTFFDDQACTYTTGYYNPKFQLVVTKVLNEMTGHVVYCVLYDGMILRSVDWRDQRVGLIYNEANRHHINQLDITAHNAGDAPTLMMRLYQIFNSSTYHPKQPKC